MESQSSYNQSQIWFKATILQHSFLSLWYHVTVVCMTSNKLNWNTQQTIAKINEINEMVTLLQTDYTASEEKKTKERENNHFDHEPTKQKYNLYWIQKL